MGCIKQLREDTKLGSEKGERHRGCPGESKLGIVLEEAFGDAQSSRLLAFKSQEDGTTKGPYIFKKNPFNGTDICTSNRRVKQAIVEKACFCTTKVSSASNRLLKLDPAITPIKAPIV